MASDPKMSAPPESPLSVKHRDKGVRIFTYPKVIFIFPTLIAALICGLGMSLIRDNTIDPLKGRAKMAAGSESDKNQAAEAAPAATNKGPAARNEERAAEAVSPRHRRFTTPQNLLGVLFLSVFAFNLLVMAIDFPRFTVVAIILLAGFGVFFILWIGAYFDVELMNYARGLMGSIYVVANAEFYYMMALILAMIFLIIYVTRFLDYWEILPNEILHHHGPLSDLERFPTMNLKLDKEIPDVLEFLLLGAGRLVLHMSEERKAIVLDNVLFINAKEEALKTLMSRLEVRVTTDQEVAEP
jgi:hypothetical protein